MAKYDKYEPLAGGFRARLETALSLVNGSIGPVAVSHVSSGRVVVGDAGQSGLVGVFVKNVARGPVGQWGTDLHGGAPNAYAPVGVQAGDVIDVMTNGEIVDLDKDDFPAGTAFYANSNGTLAAAGDADEGAIYVGHTAEAGRLIVRFGARPASDGSGS